MLRVVAIVIGLTMLTGCGARMMSSADFVPEAPGLAKAYKTYEWLPPSEDMDNRLRNPILDGRVTKAFDGEFKRKGFERLTTGTPDFKVSYFLAVQGKLDIGAVNTYYGYDWYGPTGMIMYSKTRTQEYDEGTVILDVVDGPSGQLVWRGIVQTKVTTSLDPDKRQAQINEAARKMLERFPPKG